MLRTALAESGRVYEKAEMCPVCEDIFDLVPRFADAVADKLEEVEFDNFLVGCKLDPTQAKKEKDLIAELGLGDTAEPLKTELNREIGKVALPMINRAAATKVV
jgi:tRNA pseudouridine synthase 10